MKKLLRLSLLALLALCGGGNLYAEDIIWQEDWTGWTANIDPATDTKCPSNYTFGGTTVNQTSGAVSGTKIFAETTAGGTSPELLIAKSNGSWAITIDISGKSGDVTLQWTSNNANIKPTSEDVTLSTVTAPEKTPGIYSCTFTLPSDKNSIKLTFANSTKSNGRIDNIKLYQGTSSTQPAELSWSFKTATVTLGASDNEFPELNNPNKLAVTYKSSKEEVATIDNDGNVTLVAAGTTTITASFEGDDTYEAANVNYTLTVKEAEVPEDPNAAGGENNPYTVDAALAAIDALENGATTTKEFYIKGYVVSVEEVSTQYNNLTFNIATSASAPTRSTATTLKVYRAKGVAQEDITSDDYIKVGDEVIVKGKLQKYKASDGSITPEVATGGVIQSLNGRTTTGINHLTIDADVNAPMYNLKGERVDGAYRGVVIQNGKKKIQK